MSWWNANTVSWYFGFWIQFFFLIVMGPKVAYVAWLTAHHTGCSLSNAPVIFLIFANWCTTHFLKKASH